MAIRLAQWHFDSANPLLLKFLAAEFGYPSRSGPYLEWLRSWNIALEDYDYEYYSYVLTPEEKLDFLLRFLSNGC